MKKRITEYMPRALNALEVSGIVQNNSCQKEFYGYISSLGPSIIQSGIKAASIFYSRDKNDASRNMKKVGNAILKIIGAQSNTLLEYISANDNQETKEKVLDAVIALKLSIRTFKKIDDGGKL